MERDFVIFFKAGAETGVAVGYQTLKGAVGSLEQPLLHFLACSN